MPPELFKMAAWLMGYEVDAYFTHNDYRHLRGGRYVSNGRNQRNPEAG